MIYTSYTSIITLLTTGSSTNDRTMHHNITIIFLKMRRRQPEAENARAHQIVRKLHGHTGAVQHGFFYRYDMYLSERMVDEADSPIPTTHERVCVARLRVKYAANRSHPFAELVQAVARQRRANRVRIVEVLRK